MSKKARLKKIRQQKKADGKSVKKEKYDHTQFVQQFEKMGYQVKIDPKLQSDRNRGNVSPEIPQDRIEPQL